MYSDIVHRHLMPADIVGSASASDGLLVRVDDTLTRRRSLTILELANGGGTLTLTSAHAATLELDADTTVDVDTLRAALGTAGIALAEPEYLSFLPVSEQERLRDERFPDATRQLVESDADAFERFDAGSTETERDEAYVELDHWLVYGTFVEDRLAVASSMYPWNDTPIVDLGVLTHPEYRGRGLARQTVRAISARALADGYEPQYRSSIDNSASIRLGQSAGFVRFGRRESIASTGGD